MLKGTLNSSLRLICTKKLYSDGDELSVVDCSLSHEEFFALYPIVKEHGDQTPKQFTSQTPWERLRSNILKLPL